MIVVTLSSVASALIAGLGGYLVSRKIFNTNSSVLLEQAKAKAKAIEYEAEKMLQESKIKIKELEVEAEKNIQTEKLKNKKEYEQKLLEFERKKLQEIQKIEKETSIINEEKQRINRDIQNISETKNAIKKLQTNYEEKISELTCQLSQIVSLTKKEAKELLFNKLKEECKQEAAHIIRKYETQAKEDAKERANYLLAQATSRFAGEFAAERLINTINLPSDDLKAKIIGKEGRNIKALEMTCGVDIIIDDTPGTIIVSCHNLYRRSIATKTIEQLIEDGRIQPTKIEEIYQKCFDEFETQVFKEGEQVVLDLGLNNMHPEIQKLVGKLKYRASYGQNALTHSLEVAHLAGIIAAELGGDCLLATRAGLLHDIGKSRTHDFKGSHVELGAEICRRYNEHPIVINAIMSHHGNEEAKSIEAAAVCAADALSSARPGARREVLENYLRRVSEIENIALTKAGVVHAYAINAGREVRVIVKSSDLSDDDLHVLAKDIAKDIESSVQYPGEIKVSAIRETRAYAIAS